MIMTNLFDFVPLFVGLVFLVIGIVFFFNATRNRKKAEESLLWPTTKGLICAATMKEHKHQDSKGRRTTSTYEPVIEYTYTVMGQSYTGNKVALGVRSFDSNQAYEIFNRFPLGNHVDVHYNPQNPSEAILETHFRGQVTTFIMSIALGVIGLALLIVSIFTLIS
jgi:hypothetical protein